MDNTQKTLSATSTACISAAVMAAGALLGDKTSLNKVNTNLANTPSTKNFYISDNKSSRRRDSYNSFILNNGRSSTGADLINTLNSTTLGSSTRTSSDINVPTFNVPKYWMENVKVFWEDLNQGLANGRFDVDTEIIKEVANYAASKVALIDSEDRILELSSDGSIRFTLILKDEKMLMINKPSVCYPDADVNDVLVSFFVNKELAFADTADLDEFVKKSELLING